MVRVGFIGTGELIDLTRAWVERSRSKITLVRKVLDDDGNPIFNPMDPQVYTSFPGLKSAFRVDVVLSDGLVLTLAQHPFQS
jgi:hypothetical protein